MLDDVRFAVRTLARRPLYAAAAILTLGLGVGVNTAVFTIVDTLWLRPPSVPEPSRLGVLYRETGLAGDRFLSDRLPYGETYRLNDVPALSGIALELLADGASGPPRPRGRPSWATIARSAGWCCRSRSWSAERGSRSPRTRGISPCRATSSSRSRASLVFDESSMEGARLAPGLTSRNSRTAAGAERIAGQERFRGRRSRGKKGRDHDCRTGEPDGRCPTPSR